MSGHFISSVIRTFVLMYFGKISIWSIYLMYIVLRKTFVWQLSFSFLKRVSLYSKDDFYLNIIINFIPAIITDNKIVKIIVNDWYCSIFPSLLVLFSYAQVHDYQLFEKFIFELEVFSCSSTMGLSLNGCVIGKVYYFYFFKSVQL